MRTPEYSTQFRRDVKRAAKRGKDMDKLKGLLSLLIAGEPLSPRYKDHPLKQNWLGYRDAHIEPDWLLIYALVDGADGPIVRFERTGTILIGSIDRSAWTLYIPPIARNKSAMDGAPGGDDGPGIQPLQCLRFETWGFAPGWYETGLRPFGGGLYAKGESAVEAAGASAGKWV